MVALKNKGNTSVRHEGCGMVARYHQTDIVKWGPNHIRLNSNGWATSTTKQRMNQAASEYGLGYYVFQKNFDWFVSFFGQTIPFTDGMIIDRPA